MSSKYKGRPKLIGKPLRVGIAKFFGNWMLWLFAIRSDDPPKVGACWMMVKNSCNQKTKKVFKISKNKMGNPNAVVYRLKVWCNS